MNQRPYTTRAQKALTLANAAAEELGDEFLGPEHILLGLLDEKMNIAAQILTHLGVTRSRIDDLLVTARSGHST
jgi:ATP-dependent Clp protease ATP-binding subunit ClpC